MLLLKNIQLVSKRYSYALVTHSVKSKFPSYVVARNGCTRSNKRQFTLTLNGRSDHWIKKSTLVLENDSDTNKQHYNEDLPNNQKISLAIFSSILAATILIKLKEDFVVQSAKPFNADETNKYLDNMKNLNSNDGKPTSNRQKYNFIADVVEKVADSVVCIMIKDQAAVDFLTGAPRVVSNGSGFLVSDDGLIVTNAHVIQGAERPSISVRLTDGSSYAATVEYVDIQSDLAAIRICGRGFKPLTFGCSCETKIGEWVVALGSPLSLSNTVTCGVVSSVNRGAEEIGVRNDIDYIQTDAAITFGNSGGPLVNLDCEVIGVNSMKVTSGISFAIPIDYVKKFLKKAKKMRNAGKTNENRKYVGLTLLTLTNDLLSELEMLGKSSGIKHGVMVFKVILGSPAFYSEIQPGDIILQINGKEITTVADVHNAILSADVLHLEILRNGHIIQKSLTPENISYQ